MTVQRNLPTHEEITAVTGVSVISFVFTLLAGAGIALFSIFYVPVAMQGGIIMPTPNYQYHFTSSPGTWLAIIGVAFPWVGVLASLVLGLRWRHRDTILVGWIGLAICLINTGVLLFDLYRLLTT